MSWRQFGATVARLDAEPLGELLQGLGALSVQFEDAGDQPLFEPGPGETPLWERTRVIALFEEGFDEARTRESVLAAFPGRCSHLETEALPDRVWERAWLEHFRPMRFGERLWICPSEFAPPDPSAVNVLLDPGLAFGTGTHPTTALCLEWLEVQDLTGLTLLDYGCGSGILAIAGLKLGASGAIGLDIDPQALIASAENAEKNGVSARLRLQHPKSARDPADIVVANILAGPLVELAADIGAQLRPGGRLALSGILAHQAEAVVAAYRPFVALSDRVEREEWVLLTGQKRCE